MKIFTDITHKTYLGEKRIFKTLYHLKLKVLISYPE